MLLNFSGDLDKISSYDNVNLVKVQQNKKNKGFLIF